MTDVTLTLTLFSASCLPGLLSKEIASVERHQRVCAPLDRTQEAFIDEYLCQLRNCLTEIERAKRAALGLSA